MLCLPFRVSGVTVRVTVSCFITQGPPVRDGAPNMTISFPYFLPRLVCARGGLYVLEISRSGSSYRAVPHFLAAADRNLSPRWR